MHSLCKRKIHHSGQIRPAKHDVIALCYFQRKQDVGDCVGTWKYEECRIRALVKSSHPGSPVTNTVHVGALLTAKDVHIPHCG